MRSLVRPIRVLHVRTVSGTGGGPDKTVLNSCAHLTGAGHCAQTFYIFDRQNNTAILQEKAERLGVRMYAVYENGPFSLATLRSLDKALTSGRYDIVHTHDYKSNVLARLLRCRSRHKYKIVATAHGYNRTSRREILYYALERFLLKHADAVIVPSRSLYRYLRQFRVRADRLHVIPNGIDTAGLTRPARTKKTGPTCLLYLGRLSSEKGPANLLHAAARLMRDGVDLELTLAGDGPEHSSLSKLGADLGFNGRLRMPGHVWDVMPLLSSADIFVNPSRTECMPNTLLEAMSAGVPIVATNVGGVGELIRDGVDGLLCPPADPVVLAKAIKQLVDDRVLAQRLADSAYDRVVNEFSFDRRMERIMDLYFHTANLPNCHS